MNEEITILPIDPTTFEVYDYKTTDSQLIAKSELDTVFSSSTDYIEFYVYDENQTKIYPIDSTIPLTSYSVKEGDILLNPQSDLENLGFDLGKYSITYEFYRKRLASYVNETYFIKEISSDRTEIRLDSNIINNSSIISSANEFIQYRDNAEYFVDFYLNFGSNLNIIANNIVLDDENPEDPTILIKLYEPLPENLGLKDQLWVVEMLSKPQAYQVDFPFIPIVEDDFTYIAGPNFNLNVKQESGNSSQTFSYDTLINSNVTSSVNQIKSLLNEKEIDINVNYEDFNNFVHFSTALTRLENFYYKVGLIESYNNDISTLGNISGDTTDTLAYSSSLASLTSKIDSIIQNFDGYEYFMYFNSGSDYSYPKTNTEPPFTLASTNSAEVLTWLGSADENSGDYGGVALSASLYDENNQDRLYNTIPTYLKEDPENVKYELFIDMVAQHYDNIWLYTKDITNKFNADNRLEYGISKDLIADAIKDFGVKLYSNNFNNTDLFSAFLGITPSGSLFPFPEMTDSLPAESGYEYVDTRISASNDVIPLNDVNKRLYKRIYHNIPYLLKTKGTIAGLRALITSYGIPDTILRVNEFGGKDRNEAQDWDLEQNKFNYAFDTEGQYYFSSSFVPNSDFASTNANTIQFRFKPSELPSSHNSQSLFYIDSTQYTNFAKLTLEYTGTGLTSGSYSGSIPDPENTYATLKFIPDWEYSTTEVELSLPFFNGEWWSVMAVEDNENGAYIYAASQKGFIASASIDAGDYDGSVWNGTDATIYFPYNQTDGSIIPFDGLLQEIRFYSSSLGVNEFWDYVMNPYSIKGSSINSVPNDLIFRADLGTVLNTGSRTSIHPKVTGSSIYITESFSSNSNFYLSNENFVVNKELIYQDQVPSGIKNRVTDKIHSKNINIAEAPYGLLDSSSNFPSTSDENAISPFQTVQQESFTSSSYTPDVNYLEVAFSPSNQINDDINAQLGYFNLGDYIGDPRQISSSDRSYPSLDTLRDAYFEKYISGYDVVDFVRLMKFFDNSLFKMIKDFTPARTSLSSGVVVKQHILERNRQRPAQASWSNETYSGSIKPQSRNYSTGSGDVGQYESTDGSSIYKFTGGTGGSFERYNGLQTSPQPKFYYNLVNVVTGKYLGAAPTSATPVIQRDSDVGDSTKWSLILNTDGYYNIDSKDNGVLRVTGPNFSPPFVVVSTNAEPPVFDNDKEFRLEYDPTDDTYKIGINNSYIYHDEDGSFYASGASSIGDRNKWKFNQTPPIKTNRFNLTQSYSESIEGSAANQINNEGSFVGYGEKLISDQHEFYDGEFSGSDITVTTQSLNPGCAPYLRINDTSIFFNPLFFNSTPGNATFGTVSTTEFLKRNNIPVSGDAWILSEGTGGVGNGKVTYIKLSTFDVSGVSIGKYLDDSDLLTLKLPERNAEYYINGVKSFSDHVVLSIKQDIGDFTTINSINGGSENWSLTASGNFRTGGENGDNDNESQGSFKNNVAEQQEQQFWYYNGNIADEQSFFNKGSQTKTLSNIIANPDYYGSGSYNPQRTSNINWYASCSINYSSSILGGGAGVTQSGDLYKGYKYEGVATLTDQNFLLGFSDFSGSFIPSPYSINLPTGDVFKQSYNQQIPGNSGSEAGEIGGNVKIGVEGTASFKYLAGTDSALKFDILQSPQTAPPITPIYSPISGSGLYNNSFPDENGDFFGNFVEELDTKFININGAASTWTTGAPFISISLNTLKTKFYTENGNSFPSTAAEYYITIQGVISSSIDEGQLEVDMYYSSSSTPSGYPTNISDFTPFNQENSFTPSYSSGSTLFELWTTIDEIGNGQGDGFMYLIPQFKVTNNSGNNIEYKFLDYSISVYIDDSSANGASTFELATNIHQEDSPRTGGWNLFDITTGPIPTNPTVKAKWELWVTGSGGDISIYEQTTNNPTIELSGSSPISVGFDTVDWGNIGPHNNIEDDMYYLKYTLYDYNAGLNGGAIATEFQFSSINNTGQFDTLQISQSVEGDDGNFDLTGSLNIYRGTKENPEGSIIKSSEFIVPNATTANGTFTLTGSLYNNLAADFKHDDTYRMGVSVTKSRSSGLDITAYTMSIFPSSSVYAPITTTPSYGNYKEPISSAFFIPTYFGDGVLPFEYALDCQPTLNNYIDSRTNSFIMDVDYTSEGQVTVIKDWYIDDGENNLYPYNVAESLAKVKVGQYISTPGLDVFPPRTRVISINPENGELELSANALSSHDQNLTVFFNDNSLLPVNQNQILEGTAVKATVQDSNYTSISSIRPRYLGTKTTSNQYNIWSVKDKDTFGKYPVIELKDAYFGYFKSIKDLYPLVNDKVSLELTYLLDQQSNAIPPSLDKYGMDILDKTFPKENPISIGFISSSKTAQELDDSYPIFKLTQKPSPILYTQTSSAGYASEIPLSGSGRISMYDNNDLDSFTDYSFTAQGTASYDSNNGTVEGRTQYYTQVIDPSEDVITNPYGANDYSSSYADANGVMVFNGNVEKNPQRISMQTSFATSFLNESGGVELAFDIQMLSGSTPVEFSLEDINLVVHRTGKEPVNLGSIIGSGVENLIRFVNYQVKNSGLNRFFNGQRTHTNYRRNGVYNTQRGSYYAFVENYALNDFLVQKGVYTSGKGGSLFNGDINGLEFVIKANSGNYIISNGDNIIFQIKTAIQKPKKSKFGANMLFPPDYTGPIFPSKLSTIGERTALLASDNTGSKPFWVYTGSAGGGGGNILDKSILVMSSSNINEAYGGAFYQGPLPYVPGPTEYFDKGVEPSDTQFPKITSPIEFFPGDEIRFGNNENHSYTILSVTNPESNIEGGKGRIKIKLDREVPQSINKDFFLIRRYTPKASSFILDTPFPYSAESSGSSANGIIYPTFPTEFIEDSGSLIVTDLISKGVIT